MPIRQLAPDVAAKIAAGEVVERPASVVKELIENSIDAGATHIRVDLSHGGLQLIRVTDNGSGIPSEELPLALARHATSKVSNIDDLEHIRSLGFRGEALASIAAVAEVTLVSHARGAAQGAQVSASNGQLSDVTAAAAPEGTTITVRNLFSAVPARLKFLKGRNTEVSHCHHLLEQYALAYPEIRFSVFSENRQILATPGDGQLSSVLIEMYGLQVAEQMVPISSAERPDEPDYPVVTGYTSLPTCYKSTRQHISFFVNRRWVLNRMLTAAVDGAYHSLLLTGRHPISVVNIQVDPTLLDVNVHPAKTEIRFLKERRVFKVVLNAVRAALLQEASMPEWKPREEPTDAIPSSDITDTTDTTDNASVVSLQAENDENDRPFEISADTSLPDEQEDEASLYPQDNPWLTVTEEETGTKPFLLSRLWQSHVHPSAENDNENTGVSTKRSPDVVEPSPVAETPVAHAVPTAPAMQALPLEQFEASPAATQPALLAGQSIDPRQTRHLPRLRVVGQLSQSYIVTEGDDGMYLIDQHAAHERIVLERMVAALKARTPISQHLLTPMLLNLAPSELEAIEDHQQQLSTIGFDLEATDHATVTVRAVPSVLVKHLNAKSLHELLLDLTAPENLGHTETWEERALANVACKAAIKANYFLTVSEMREMIEQLEQTKAPYSCCHGRPTMVHFSLSSLAHEFERR